MKIKRIEVRVTGATPVHMSASPEYRAIVRAIHTLDKVDRLGLAFLTGIPYGSASRIISELCNEGYLTAITEYKETHTRSRFRYPMFTWGAGKKYIWTYSHANESSSQIYVRSVTWPWFMSTYEKFLKKVG